MKKCINDSYEKRKKTCLKKYGVEHPMQAKSIQQKMKQTNVRKYGVEYALQSNVIKQKFKETCLKKLGVENPSQSKIIKEKKKQTTLAHFGVTCSLQDAKIKDKIKKICLKKYGVEYSSQTKESRNKFKKTCLEKFGVENPSQAEEIKKKIRKFYTDKMTPYVQKLIESKNLECYSLYNNATDLLKLKCKTCGELFEKPWFYIQQGGSCPKCFPKKSSKSETNIREFVESLGFKIVSTDRKLIKPLELDIVIPNKKVAIEYCGFYWHSSGGKSLISFLPADYHLKKLNECNKIGYHLITIFEDEWILKPDIVKNRLKHILGIQADVKIRASKCIIKEIDPKTKNEFLNKYHIQGSDKSRIKLGAFYNSELISVMTFSKPSISKGTNSKNKKDVWELNRFCSCPDLYVYGIASKLLKHFKENYEWKNIYSYADRRWSKGNVYNKLGFEEVTKTDPNYWYWGNKIIGKAHRFNYHKSNLKNMKNFNNDFSELQIMLLEGYSWIFDCGNLKFETRRK